MVPKKVLGWLVAMLSGALFAVGLVISGMTDTRNVRGFLNVAGIVMPERFGAWNPALAFVMVGALLVTFIAFTLIPREGKRPWFAMTFDLPRRVDIDVHLIVGAVLFGIGWGLLGYCPGPALASVLLGGHVVVWFVMTMLLFMWLTKRSLK